MIGEAILIKEGPQSGMWPGPGDLCSRQTEEHMQRLSGGMTLVSPEQRGPVHLAPPAVREVFGRWITEGFAGHSEEFRLILHAVRRKPVKGSKQGSDMI